MKEITTKLFENPLPTIIFSNKGITLSFNDKAKELIGNLEMNMAISEIWPTITTTLLSQQNLSNFDAYSLETKKLCMLYSFKSSDDLYIVSFVDLTFIAEVENQVAEQRVGQAEERKNRLLSDLAKDFAHEINNPLMVAHGNFVSLRNKLKDNNDSEIAKKLFAIETSLTKIRNVIHDRKSIADKNIYDTTENYNLKDLVTECFDGYKETFRLQQITTKINIEPNLLPLISRRELNLVFIELINNSLYFLKDTKSAWIHVNANISNNSLVTIEFIDSGTGVAIPNPEQIFKPFYTTKKMGDGLGSGLTHIKEILKRNSADIHYNEENTNTMFVLTIPIEALNK